MLNLTEPYSPFSTTTFTFLVIRLCQNFPATFYYPTKITLRDKGMPRYPTPHILTQHTKKPENKTSLALIHLIPLADYNIKVLSINQKLIKIWKKKHYSN
jgi:hypothetical protein